MGVRKWGAGERPTLKSGVRFEAKFCNLIHIFEMGCRVILLITFVSASFLSFDVAALFCGTLPAGGSKVQVETPRGKIGQRMWPLSHYFPYCPKCIQIQSFFRKKGVFTPFTNIPKSRQ